MRFETGDHAAGIAGVAPFVAGVVPWSVSGSAGSFSRSVVVRFVFGVVEVGFGARSTDPTITAVSVTRVGPRAGGALSRAIGLWLVAAAVLALALVVGTGLLLSGERFTRGVFDPVRLVGLLCLAAALLLSGSAWLYYHGTSQRPIPVGVVAFYLFGAGLLTIDRSRTGRRRTGSSG